MLSTLKSYANQDTGVSYVLSYVDGSKNGATLSIFAGAKQTITFDLDPADLKALSQLTVDASYDTSNL